MELVFLGTGSMVPTKERNHSAILLRYGGDNILIDCGEGTQRQFKFVGISPTKITKLLITHWHGDHVLGIPGLIQTLGACEYNKKLEIYGPKKTKIFMKKMLDAFVLEEKIDMEIHEINGGKFYENEDFILEAINLEHGIKCLGYSFIEKDKRKINVEYLRKFGLVRNPILKDLKEGKTIVWKNKKITPKEGTIIKKGRKITIIADTKYCENAIKLAKNSDILVCESTFSRELIAKAKEYKHMTTEEAAKIAKYAKAKKLYLTHFSQRYKDTKPLVKEARKIFKNTFSAEDFLKIKI